MADPEIIEKLNLKINMDPGLQRRVQRSGWDKAAGFLYNQIQTRNSTKPAGKLLL